MTLRNEQDIHVKYIESDCTFKLLYVCYKQTECQDTYIMFVIK